MRKNHRSVGSLFLTLAPPIPHPHPHPPTPSLGSFSIQRFGSVLSEAFSLCCQLWACSSMITLKMLIFQFGHAFFLGGRVSLSFTEFHSTTQLVSDPDQKLRKVKVKLNCIFSWN